MFDPFHGVDRENRDGGTTDCRRAFENGVSPTKVNVPAVTSGMEQADELIVGGFVPGDVGSLVRIAARARETEVGESAFPAVLLRPDVIDFVW